MTDGLNSESFMTDGLMTESATTKSPMTSPRAMFWASLPVLPPTCLPKASSFGVHQSLWFHFTMATVGVRNRDDLRCKLSRFFCDILSIIQFFPHLAIPANCDLFKFVRLSTRTPTISGPTKPWLRRSIPAPRSMSLPISFSARRTRANSSWKSFLWARYVVKWIQNKIKNLRVDMLKSS